MTGARRVRIETLSRELAVGKPVEQAMLAAGYAPETARQGRIRHAGRLVSPHNHPAVAAGLAELQATANQRTAVTVQDIVNELDLAFQIARAASNPSAMIAATMGKAKVLGLIADKRKHKIKPIDQWTEEECDEFLNENGANG